jgi:uncharacterized protein DUF4199
MKRIVWTFGLIAGGVLSVMMLVTLPFEKSFANVAEVVGYTTMVLAFLLIYFGIRTYRDTVGGGSVGFGRALAIGALITTISSLCYVATWEALYFKLAPDMAARFDTVEIEKAKRSATSPEEAQRKVAETQRFLTMYKNPVMNSAMTFLEPLPVGLVITLVSAGVLRRKREDQADGTLATSTAL